MNYLRRFFEEHVDPAERLTEMVFALLMVLTCTLGASLTVEEGREASPTDRRDDKRRRAIRSSSDRETDVEKA